MIGDGLTIGAPPTDRLQVTVLDSRESTGTPSGEEIRTKLNTKYYING